jgi:hypothetical protein
MFLYIASGGGAGKRRSWKEDVDEVMSFVAPAMNLFVGFGFCDGCLGGTFHRVESYGSLESS